MKKIIIALTAAMMALSFASCGEISDSSRTDTTSKTSASSKAETKTPSKVNKTISKTNNKITAKSDKNPASSKASDAKTTPAEIEAKISVAIGSGYLCDTDMSKDTLSGLFGLDLDKVEAYAAKENSISSVNLDEIIVLKVKDGYAKTAVDSINTAYDQIVAYARHYEFGTQKVLNARIYTDGNYIMFVIAGTSADDNASAEEELKLAKSEYEKIDNVWKEIFGSIPDNQAVVPEEDSNADDSGAVWG